MSKTRIVITEFLEAEAIEELKRLGYDVHWDKDLWTKRAELEKLMPGLPALIVRNKTKVDKALLDLAPDLKVIGRLGVGLDNLDMVECGRRNIEVCAARGANATSVAEYVIATAMMLLRGRAYLDSHRVVAGEWARDELGSQGSEIAGKTLGIIGYGSIGGTTARKARALDMHVIAADSYLPDGNENWNLAEKVSVDDLLARADVVTVHCPLSPETRNLIDAKRIAKMKKGAILINSARGGIVDEVACAAALKSGHLGGAALDVFEVEPIKPEAGKVFAGIPNVLLTPHISGVTREANHRVSSMTVESVVRVLKKGL